MLKKFTVSNYRSFENPITLDFTNVRDYDFNEECIKDGLINKAVIYGENAVGKTNLGLAISDVVTMIPSIRVSTDILIVSHSKSQGFINKNSSDKVAKFEYVIKIGSNEILYTYEKFAVGILYSESLRINNELLYELNFETGMSNFSNFQNYSELATLNIEDWDNRMSVLAYVLSHTKLKELTVLKELESFIKGILISRDFFSADQISLSELLSMRIHHIVEYELVSDFEKFLQELSIDIKLKVVTMLDGGKELYIDYGEEKGQLSFVNYASSGTLSLAELYLFVNIFQPTFLYIDEFDANFHFGVAKKMFEKFKQKLNCQTVITTHNTDLMSNAYLRPDCYFIMSPNKIVNLADATRRKLSIGHDLEILYHAGGFNKLGVDNG